METISIRSALYLYASRANIDQTINIRTTVTNTPVSDDDIHRRIAYED